MTCNIDNILLYINDDELLTHDIIGWCYCAVVVANVGAHNFLVPTIRRVCLFLELRKICYNVVWRGSVDARHEMPTISRYNIRHYYTLCQILGQPVVARAPDRKERNYMSVPLTKCQSRTRPVQLLLYKRSERIMMVKHTIK